MATVNTPSDRLPTDDEIEADVLAKISDRNAWEPLEFVPPSRSPRPAWMLRGRHLELAAKFHVLYLLHLLGVEANLALSQPDNVDITVLREDGQALTIDVKTLIGAQPWYVDGFAARKHHYIVFVDFIDQVFHAQQSPKVYVTASERLHNLVNRKKLDTLPLDILQRELNARDAWAQLLSETAA